MSATSPTIGGAYVSSFARYIVTTAYHALPFVQPAVESGELDNPTEVDHVSDNASQSNQENSPRAKNLSDLINISEIEESIIKCLPSMEALTFSQVNQKFRSIYLTHLQPRIATQNINIHGKNIKEGEIYFPKMLHNLLTAKSIECRTEGLLFIHLFIQKLLTESKALLEPQLYATQQKIQSHSAELEAIHGRKQADDMLIAYEKALSLALSWEESLLGWKTSFPNWKAPFPHFMTAYRYFSDTDFRKNYAPSATSSEKKLHLVDTQSSQSFAQVLKIFWEGSLEPFPHNIASISDFPELQILLNESLLNIIKFEKESLPNSSLLTASIAYILFFCITVLTGIIVAGSIIAKILCLLFILCMCNALYNMYYFDFKYPEKIKYAIHSLFIKINSLKNSLRTAINRSDEKGEYNIIALRNAFIFNNLLLLQIPESEIEPPTAGQSLAVDKTVPPISRQQKLFSSVENMRLMVQQEYTFHRTVRAIAQRA